MKLFIKKPKSSAIFATFFQNSHWNPRKFPDFLEISKFQVLLWERSDIQDSEYVWYVYVAFNVVLTMPINEKQTKMTLRPAVSIWRNRAKSHFLSKLNNSTILHSFNKISNPTANIPYSAPKWAIIQMDSIKSKYFRRGLEKYSYYGTPCTSTFQKTEISRIYA